MTKLEICSSNDNELSLFFVKSSEVLEFCINFASNGLESSFSDPLLPYTCRQKSLFCEGYGMDSFPESEPSMTVVAIYPPYKCL